jgi:type IV pilus assembly protein PilB
MEVMSRIAPAGNLNDRLGLALIRDGLVETETIEKALKVKEKSAVARPDRPSRRNLAQILVEDFRLDHDIVFRYVAEVYGFKSVKLTTENHSDSRIEFIRRTLEGVNATAKDYMVNMKILPFRYDAADNRRLIFIAADPTDPMIPVIARAMRIQLYDILYVRMSEITELIEKIFPPENRYLKDIEASETDLTGIEEVEEEFDEALIEAEITKSIYVNLAEGMLIEAVRMGASDIHIYPSSGNATEILFRIDGLLRPWLHQEGVRPEAIAAVMKDRAKNVDRFERESAQDGYIQRKILGHDIRFRVSIMPIVGSEYSHKFESIVIRILDDRQVITDLNRLGFRGHAHEMFLKAISQPQGMVIVTGPTGSGKSTTLIAALSHIVRPEINILTVEDPVEYIIPGVRQLKIGHKMNFEQALRSILRHDPDVVMVGEIRDKETGEMAIKLANTGHLTFSTLHTNDAPSAVSRLYKMGIETFLIAYAINIIIAQRLMRRLCENCKRPMSNLAVDLAQSLGFKDSEIENFVFFEAVGCDKCHGGYKGRLAIHEALYFTPGIRRMIFEAGNNINEEAIRQQAIADGMKTLLGSARENVLMGVSTIEEVKRVVTGS